MLPLNAPVQKLHHIGEKTAPRLKRLHIETVGDLLWHLPQRYEDLRAVYQSADAPEGELITVRGIVTSVKSIRSFKKRISVTDIRLQDASGMIKAVWFGQSYLAKTIKVGDDVYLSGKATRNLTGVEFTNPVYEKAKDQQLHTAHIIPFYALTEGVSHKQLRFLIQTALNHAEQPHDTILDELIGHEALPTLGTALKLVHFPEQPHDLDKAIRRLKYEELFWLQLSVAYARTKYRAHEAPSIPYVSEGIAAWVATLPFTLTNDQKKTMHQILTDLTKQAPMNRLVQGDVGSGKTVVAQAGMLSTAIAGLQSAIMAPTEVLALQHYHTLESLLPHIPKALLTAHYALINKKKASRAKVLHSLQSGETLIIAGTHSLIQRDVSLPQVGLIVIDEQHRFGVEQRKQLTALRSDHKVPHLLSLTATPIPRTLALTLYGDLELSTIKERPKGRKPIITKIVDEKNREKAYAFIRSRIKNGEQVFILCPLINESDTNGSTSVLTEYERLRTHVFPDLEIRYLHGKIRSDEKKEILDAFKRNTFPILVTTSVIEVGIDIPQATIMWVEGAERFGLAQLHQFRGRVGRNNLQSYCFLFSNAATDATRRRLELMSSGTDGFALAEADLKLRGEGEVFGTRQSGIALFKVATVRDTDIITTTKKYVDALVAKDTNLTLYHTLRDKLDTRLGIHWE